MAVLRNIILASILLSGLTIHAQTFEVTNIRQQQGKVFIDYKIDTKYTKERYRVSLYASHNNFSSPLQYVSGDLQGEIGGSGQTRTIEWNAQRELKNFDGQIQFELRGEVIYVPVHTLTEIEAKVENTTAIEWDGGENTDQIKIELVRNGEVVRELTETQNTGSYNWIPEKELKGSGYQIRFRNLNNSGETFETDPFKIRSKVGLALKLAPVGALVIAGVIYLVSRDKDNGGGGGESDSLPEPSDPEWPG